MTFFAHFRWQLQIGDELLRFTDDFHYIEKVIIRKGEKLEYKPKKLRT